MKNSPPNLINGVMDLSHEFMEYSKFVTIDGAKINVVAEDLKKSIEEQSEFWLGYPKWFEPEVRSKEEIDYMLLCYELMAGAVNYQYWYGKSDIRPNGSGATLMYELLDESFERAGSMHTIRHRVVCKDAAMRFMSLIALYRLPNADKRIAHVKEILDTMEDGHNDISYMVLSIHDGTMGVDDFLKEVVTSYPGYAGDMFLKRPFLLAMMLYRRVKWFEDDIPLLPIPADYQIPKMLRWKRCVKYSHELNNMVTNSILIPSGSLIECEIRAASIITCEALANRAGVTMCDVDTYLWLNRKKCTDLFHLTITTDY